MKKSEATRLKKEIEIRNRIIREAEEFNRLSHLHGEKMGTYEIEQSIKYNLWKLGLINSML